MDTKALRSSFESLADRLYIDLAFSVVLISDRAMQRFNRDFRGKNRPTDVLSFRTDEADRAMYPYLGDVLISVETAERQRRQGLANELLILGLHGILHLLGYDHERDSGEMVALETKLRKEMGLK